MPSSNPRISITITDPLNNALETLWLSYPELRGSLLESVQFLMIQGAKKISDDEGLSRPNAANTISYRESSGLTDREVTETANPDDEWS